MEIITSINSVIYSLRRNKNWAIDNSFKDSEFNYKRQIDFIEIFPNEFYSKESKLLANFSILKFKLENKENLDPSALFHPFLCVIKSGETTGAITQAALDSLEKFIDLELISNFNNFITKKILKHAQIHVSIGELVTALTRCKFEATDSVNDEIVLSSILRLLTKIITKKHNGKSLVSDGSLCEMIEVAFGMYFQHRISDFLRHCASNTLILLTRAIFSRLKELTTSLNSHFDFTEFQKELQENSKNTLEFVPFGFKSVVELLRVIGSLLDPSNKQQIDSVHRYMALVLLSTGLETAGTQLSLFISWALSKNGVKFKGFTRKKSVVDLSQRHVASLHGTISMTENSSPPPVVQLATHISNSNPAELENQTINDEALDRVDVPLISPIIASPPTRLNSIAQFEDAPAVGPDVAFVKPKTKNSSLIFRNSGDFGPMEIMRMGLIAKELIANDICKYIFQLLQAYDLSFNSPPSWPIISLNHQCLKALVALFITNRIHLKYQLEWFLNWSIEIVDSGLLAWDIEEWMSPVNNAKSEKSSDKATSPKRAEIIIGEIREMVLSSLYQLIRDKSFMAEMYLNYDGDMSMETNLYETLIRFLARHSFPDATFGGPITSITHQAVCFDTILAFLSGLLERANGEVYSSKLSPASLLLSNRTRKKILIEGTLLFNQKPKNGIPFLQEHGFLPNPSDPSSIALFLVQNPFVDKKLLGIYLSKPENQEILKVFVGQLGFKGKRIDEALRIMLERFRLPGESQQIERILDAFAESFFADMSAENSPIENSSVACVLAYSIIMLHTDQHNPQVRRRMTFEDYSKNLRGCNEGKDFDLTFLREIYDAIKEKEILMPEEQGGHIGFNHYWNEIQAHSDAYSPLSLVPGEVSIYDKDMFSSVWGPIVASLFYVFDSTEDPFILEKAILGIYNCASLASAHQLTEIFDFILLSLIRTSGLFVNEAHSRSDSLASDYQAPSWKQSELLVGFGRSKKQQIAALLIFKIAFKHPHSLVEGWVYFIKLYCFLFENELLPENLVHVDDLIGGNYKLIPLPTKRSSSNEVEFASRKEIGLLSTLTQLLSLSSSEEEREQLERANYLSVARDCILQCSVDLLTESSSTLDDHHLQLLFKAILESSFSDTNQNSAVTSASIENEIRDYKVTEKLSNSSMYLLKLASEIVAQNLGRFSILADAYIAYITKIMQKGSEEILAVRSILICILNLTKDMVKQKLPPCEIRRVFMSVLQIDITKFPFFAETMMAGIASIIHTSLSWLEDDLEIFGKVLYLISSAAMLPPVAERSFNLACLVLNSNVIRKERYGECVDLLLSYLTAAASVTPGSSLKGYPVRPEKDESKPLPVVQVSLKALDKLYDLRTFIPHCIEGSSSQKQRAFFEFWLPILSGLSQQCYHPLREIRQQSFSLVQKVLLSKDLEEYSDESPHIWIACFDSVVFPLIDELLNTDSKLIAGMDETQMRGFALMCRFFLHVLPNILSSKELNSLWDRILAYTRSYFENVESTDYLKEGAQESLKNMLLVLSTQGVLQEQDNDPPGINLWKSTWQVLDTILPKFKEELFTSKPTQ